ncbi:MAG: ABC transporter ATP-binding protein [Chthoniobacterales bacterium]
MIELRKITRRYRQGESPVIALNKVDLQIQDKAFVAIVGESGSGKSTLLHLLGGLDKPDEGEILVDGWSLTSASEREMTQYRRTRLGFVFQFFNLLPTLNVLENVCLPLQLQGRKEKETRERAFELLEMVGLPHRVRHFVHQLSGGEMQRAAIARALIHRPSLLLADEPTGNLDTENANRVMEAFRWIGDQGLTTLLIATHSSAIAASAHRVVRLVNGSVASDERLSVTPRK